MLDLDKFIIELDRLTTAVHFYDEIYGEKDTIETMSALSGQAAKIIQLSLHNDIVMSLSRLLFDGKEYRVAGNTYEYLSQYNLATKYGQYIDSNLSLHRGAVEEIKKKLNVKDYRDLVLAHNNKATLTGQKEHPKHNIETSLLLKMLQESRQLFFGIRLKVAEKNGEASLPITNCDVHKGGAGSSFLGNIRNITKQARGC